MSDPDVEEIVTYISTKLNKIFYDREFVSCVANDFQKLKSKNIKCCVLVFPALGPIYQRALKYQAKAFDLATFGLSGGTFKTIAVCQKEYLLNENKQEIPEEKEKMSSESLSRDASTRKKRPERQLYVPPAQRKLAQSKDVKENKSEIKSYKVSITPLANEVPRSKITLPDSKVKKQTERTQRENRYAAESNIFLDGTQCSKRRGSKVQCEVSNEPENATIILKDNVEEVNSEKVYESILFLSDLMHLNFLPLSKYSCNVSHKIDDNTLSLKNFHECSCEFHQFLISRCENILGYFIPIYRPNDVNLLKVLINNYFCWQPLSTENLIIIDEIIENNCAIPFFNYIKNADDSDILKCDSTNSFTINQIKLCTKIKTYTSERLGIMQVNLVGDKYETETIFNENFDVSNLLTIIVCDNEPFENIVDLSKFAMGHYFKIPEANGSEHYHICDQRHDVQKCYMEVKQKISLGNVSRTNQGTSSKQEQTNKSESLKPLPIDDVKHNETVEIVNHPKQEITQQTLKIITKPEGKTSTEMDSKKKCEHEQEKEIMRKAKENINRKTRPLMKYSDDSDDLLRIDKHDNVNNWEDLFDDNGQIQDELLTEIVHKVGNDMTIVKASEDYTPYMRKHTEEDMEHVVEIYDFPPSLNTGDIILAFSMFDSDSMYVIWIDHTHALLVLGSSSQAQKAMEVKHPLIKMRPMSNASTIAMATARQYDLKPAMKRPPTNLQTARRLITNHLGTKSQVTKEQTAREREQMRQAREKRNITKRNEKDAWEGNVRSSMRQ